MSLKQSVVIVNEFTTKTAKGGSRGGTPGDYVLRYMARDGATEDLSPIRMDTENFIMRYMARDEAVDRAESVSELKQEMRDIQGQGGVAFGYGDFSLSHKKLKAASKDIQKNFDAGKTVMKTVLSFDEAYLRQHRIIDDDFQFQREGDYRGNIDQMKLRMAIMNGLDKMSRNYDDLQYIGVIQVDTKHVHCHLAMVDRGVGTIMPDGTQRGKITEREKADLRRGIDMFLDEKQSVRMMAANVEHDRQNTICYVKKFTHKAMENRGFTQFLIACLPDDKSKWRAGSNSKEMQKANAIVREYVTELLAQPDSGYDDAIHQVNVYASSRAKNEDLTGKEFRELQKEGRRRIIEESMNSVYSILKQIPDDEMDMRTPMLETMALSYEDMANEVDTDPMIEFGFKLRSYKSRLDYHKKERHKYHDAVAEYEMREKAGEADEASKPLYDFFKNEEEYNAMLLAKYQYFLKFLPPDAEYQSEYDELMKYMSHIDSIEQMRNDLTMRQMTADEAEEYGKSVYGETGGRQMVIDIFQVDERLRRMRQEYAEMRENHKFNLSEIGLSLNDEDAIVSNPAYSFNDVKALDLHHLMYDFPSDFNISNSNATRFMDATEKRYELYQKAKEYLEKSNQEDMIDTLPGNDIEAAKEIADRFKGDSVMHTKREVTPEKRRATRTVRIDYDFYEHQEEEIKNMIKNTINSLQYE